MLQDLHNPAAWPGSWWTAVLVTLAFATLARILRGVTPSGAVAGGAVCLTLCMGAGWGALAALVSVFALTWIATRFGYRRKQALGKAEQRNGRGASQVLSNLGVAAGFALGYAVAQQPVYLLAVSAALAEAAADTVASEVGQASAQTARLVTSWQQVPAGTDGAISLTGTLAGVGAATIVSLVSLATGLVPANWIGISILGASTGMVVDSYLGAWLQRRGMLTNDLVNLLGTLSGALITMIALRVTNF